MPAALQACLDSTSAILPTLMKRYCTVLPTMAVLDTVQRCAAAAGCQLLSFALSDEMLSLHSMHVTQSVLSELHAALAPFLSGSVDDARLLSSLANTLLTHADFSKENGPLPSSDAFEHVSLHMRLLSNEQREALATVASIVLTLSEAPRRITGSIS